MRRFASALWEWIFLGFLFEWEGLGWRGLEHSFMVEGDEWSLVGFACSVFHSCYLRIGLLIHLYRFSCGYGIHDVLLPTESHVGQCRP